MTLPRECSICHQRASVIYRTDTDHPIPRCWTHAPDLPTAVALGWIDPPTGTDRRDKMKA